MYYSRRSRAGRTWLARAPLLGVLSLSACASLPEPACTRSELIGLRLEPRAQLNEDREGHPRSLVLRIYQLAQREPFERARFDDHFASGGGQGGHVAALASDELTVIPGKHERRAIARDPKASHLAVVGKFREHHTASAWRATIALPPARNACLSPAEPVAKEVTLELQNYALQLR